MKTTAKYMLSSEKLDVIRTILGWSKADDGAKAYLIQSFLLNWTSKERIDELDKTMR